MAPYDDDDERRENILKRLGGEVDDFAGSQLKDPDEKGADGSQGVTIEISVKPHGAPDGEAKPFEGKETPEEEGEEHDMIAHVLGMHGGGCAY